MPVLLPNGLLIAIEGIDGAGKTTQAERLEQALRSGGYEVVRSKEPTNGTWGRKLRESAQTGRLSIEEELELFLKDRREHVDTLIRPALKAGKIVIIDRYYFSTAAYQGARGKDPVTLLKLNEEFAPRPDVLLLLDVEPKVGLQRIAARGDFANHFEQEANLSKVAKIFRKLDLEKRKIPLVRRIKGDLPAEDITSGILDLLYEGPLSTRAPNPNLPPDVDSIPNGEIWTALAKVGNG